MLAYVHFYKTAGTTLTGILRRNFSARHFDTRLIQEEPPITAAQLKRALLLYPRVTSIAGHAVRTHTDLNSGFPDIRFYTFLRDPRKRLVSAYQFLRLHMIRREGWRPKTDKEIEDDFVAFAGNTHNSYVNALVPNGRGVDAAIEAVETKLGFVGLVEHFDESLALFRNWAGLPNLDLRYRRLNVSEECSEKDRSLAPVRDTVERLVQVTNALAVRPDVAEMIVNGQADDIGLFDHVRATTFENMRRDYDTGPGPFDFEDNSMKADSISGRLYRNLIGRPFVHLIAKQTK